jgi:pyruvate kinase
MVVMKKNKIIATIGPSCFKIDTLKEMILSGVDAFRFNFSHGDHESHRDNFNKLRNLAKSLDRPLTLIQDLSGPKIRIGDVVKSFNITRGDRIHILKNCLVGDANKLGINYPEIIDKLDIGSKIYLADGLIALIIREKFDDGVVAEALNNGPISSKKGLNFPNVTLDLPALTDKDINDIKFGTQLGFDYIALSFVKNKKDILDAKNIIASYNSDIPIIAKIEKHEAITNIDDIIDAADAIMVARGDLGIEVDIEEIPLIQKNIIKKSNEAGKPVIVATQMLTSMIFNKRPTRAEVADIANAVIDGTDALMVSDETAIGKYPVEVIETMNKTITYTESMYNFYKYYNYSHATPDISIAAASCNLAKDLDASMICAFTKTGATARFIAKHRPKCAIYAAVYNEKIYNRLNIVWGIEPFIILKESYELEQMLVEFIKAIINKKILQLNEISVITMGYPAGEPGSTNLIRVLRTPDYERFLNCDAMKNND